MATINCKYHPQTPARWHCNQCGFPLCTACTVVEERKEPVHVCPVCRSDLFQLSAGNVIVPFWNRIPKFFAYPFKTTALAYIVVLTLLSTVMLNVSMFGLLIQLAILGVFLRYCYAVLDSTANGHMSPPAVDFEMVNSGMNLPLKQLVVLIMMGVIAYYIGKHLGPMAALIYWFFMLFALPATAIIIARDNSAIKALNPIALASIIKNVGLPYLVLYVFLMLLLGGQEVLFSFVKTPSNLYVFYFMYTLASMYFMLIMFNMMGYLVFQYHEELGYYVEVDVEEAMAEEKTGSRARSSTSRTTPAAAPASTEIGILIKEGKYDDAVLRLRQEVTKDPENIDLMMQLFKLYAKLNKTDLLMNAAPIVMGKLYEKNRPKQMADVYLQALSVDEGFLPPSPDHFMSLIRELITQQKFKLVMQLVNAFIKNHSQHKHMPEIYFTAAKLLCERFKQDDKARAVLQKILKTYPDHPILLEVQQYQKMLQEMAG